LCQGVQWPKATRAKLKQGGRGAGRPGGLARAVPVTVHIFSLDMNTRQAKSKYKRVVQGYICKMQSTRAFERVSHALMQDLIVHGTAIVDCKKLADDIAVELNL